MLHTLLSQVVAGLVLGGLYVLIAVGLSIVFGLLGIVNFAHGNFFALGAYFVVTLFDSCGLAAFIIAPILVGIVGMIQALLRLVYGGIGQPFSTPHVLSGVYLWGPILITRYRLAVFVVTVAILIGLWAFMQFTPFGRILRAGARDPEMVALLGIPLPRVLTAAFGLGCCLAGVAGVLAAPLWTVTPAMSESAIMPAFVVVTIGGLGSFAGAVIAGLLVGVVTALTIQFAPDAATAMMYVFMAVVLLIRPRGLLGERWERFE
jgi:branched-chain amino acid transport system permease protein